MRTIPFEIPDDCLARYAAGELKRVGVNLVRRDNGQIVRHLQEAGRLSSQLAGGFNPIVQAGQLASSLAANVQLEQVKKMLGALQIMTSANLAVSAIGLGVSVAGFIVVGRRLEQLRSSLERVEGRLATIDEAVARLDFRQRARERADVFSLLERGDEAWKRTDSEKVWMEVEQRLHSEASFYKTILEMYLEPNGTPNVRRAVRWEDMVAAHETLSQLVAARTKCLVLLNELEAALDYATRWHLWLSVNYEHLTPPRLADLRTHEELHREKIDQDSQRLSMLSETEEFLRIVRVQQEFAESLPALMGSLIGHGIVGREYVERLANETKEPILLLEAKSD